MNLWQRNPDDGSVPQKGRPLRDQLTPHVYHPSCGHTRGDESHNRDYTMQISRKCEEILDTWRVRLVGLIRLLSFLPFMLVSAVY